MNRKNLRTTILSEILKLLNEGSGSFFADLAELAKLASSATFKNFVNDFKIALAAGEQFATLTKETNAEVHTFFTTIGADYNKIVTRDAKGNLRISIRNALDEIKRVSGATDDTQAFMYLRNPEELARELEHAPKALTLTNILNVVTPDYLNSIAENYVKMRAPQLKAGMGLNTSDMSNFITSELLGNSYTKDLFKGITQEGVTEFLDAQLPEIVKWVEANKRRLGAAKPFEIANLVGSEGSLSRKAARLGLDVARSTAIVIIVVLILNAIVKKALGIDLLSLLPGSSSGASSRKGG